MRLTAAAIAVFVLAAACPAARAAPPDRCDIPAEALPQEVALPAAKAAVASRRQLTIMTVGGAPMAGAAAGDPANSYPARMRDHLAQLLPGVEVLVVNKAAAGRSAQGMSRRLASDTAEVHPDLVVWASGTREAARNTDPDAYAAQLEEGIATIRRAGADAILVDTQFAPGWGGIVHLDTYRAIIRGVAELVGVAVFPRYDLMREWHESGRIDLEAHGKARQTEAAVQLFDCVGKGLAMLIERGVR